MSCTTSASLRASSQHNRHPSYSTAASRAIFITTTITTTTNSSLAARQDMPSPRNSPALRPTSPLSPAYKTSPHFDTLQPPQQRPMHSRTNSNQRRAPSSSLKLPSLPRFHPANFPSSNHSSVQTTPDGTSSSQPPMSPRTFQRMYSDAQKQLYFNQREMFVNVARSPSQTGKPTSPRLQPLGSPGPVTPLELEGEEGYLIAGARNAADGSTRPEELAERMIREETRRQRNAAPR